MFRCESSGCGKVQPSRQPVNRIVTARREMFYENKIERGKQKGQIKTTQGSETITEITVCPTCYQDLTGKQPRLLIATVTKPHFRQRFNTKPPAGKKRPWKNPKAKERSQKSSQDRKAQSEPLRKGPIVEIVNPLTIVNPLIAVNNLGSLPIKFR